ncbi:Oidioi.mRNA.OKI2018_I69.chr2.g7722.t1.cds [Oikopleura dioica]|uniref:Protein Wnt n=1 Tax=Oikopleura dioica TaxID=34765 RepID=A0ABN7TDU5_OIKDI|nr:Oidioi.mRNA.OKI2018_I69.chr2.g7722.t1.cds [Oikopleura dioica]
MKISGIILAFTEASSLSWIGIRSWTGDICAYSGLTSQQANLCRRNKFIAPAIKNAAQIATSACFDSMSDTLWGCNGIKTLPKEQPELEHPTQESAYLHALATGHLKNSLEKFCKMGSADCEKFNAEQFALEFTDVAAFKKKHFLFGLHNNKIGRHAAESAKNVVCKCHGPSGSCAQKTCWKATTNEAKMNKIIKDKYESAARIHQRQLEILPQAVFSSLINDRLIFGKKSPNFCEVTRGRVCDATKSYGPGSCDELCCGRGSIEKISIETEEVCTMEFVKVDGFSWPVGVSCKDMFYQKTTNTCR